MGSRVAWLSPSSTEIAGAQHAEALTPGAVIDQLRFLPLQGAFADYFYLSVATPIAAVTLSDYFDVSLTAEERVAYEGGFGIGRPRQVGNR